MPHLHCLPFGKLKHPAYRSLADEHLKRIRSWLPVTETELRPTQSSGTPSPAQRMGYQEAEATAFQEFIEKKSIHHRSVIVLDASGEPWDSRQWADFLQNQTSPLGLSIGSTWGWQPSVLKSFRAVSFGRQTMAHELARVVAYEQVYRALALLRNHPYHFENKE